MEAKLSKSDINNAVVCSETDSVIKAAKVMKVSRERHIYVIDKKQKPVGLISVTDISNRIVADEKDPKKLKAKDIMTSPVNSFKLGDSIEKILKVMGKQGIFICPVTEKNKIIGECSMNSLINKLNRC